MSHEPLDESAREVAEEAAEWLAVLENGSAEDRAVFVAWLKKAPQHLEEMLYMTDLDAALSVLLLAALVGAFVLARREKTS